jgi:hypothetical protein
MFNMISGSTNSPCGKTPSPTVLPFSTSWNTQKPGDRFSSIWALPPISGSNNRLYSPDPYNKPPRFRVGDINIDGLQDILITLGQSSGTYGVPILLINTYGSTQPFTYSESSSTLGTYYTVYQASSNQQLVQIPVLYASFFDFDELGY